MTFAVRTITRSATGGDIVHRPVIIEGDQVVIGRGADCQVRLPDLVVSLQHASLKDLGGGKVEVQALGGEPFEVDGRFTSQARLDLAAQPRLSFGDHVLALSADDAGGVIIDVTKREGSADQKSGESERSVFTLATAVIGKRPVAWTLAAAALALCLILPILGFVSQSNGKIHADQQWSAGPLSKAHAFLNQDCQACHVKAFVSVRDETCLTCHKAGGSADAIKMLAEKVRTQGGGDKLNLVKEHASHDLLMRGAPSAKDPVGILKASFSKAFGHTSDRCASCHLEHLADTAGKPGAATSGPKAVPHLVPVLRTTYDCAACHNGLRQRLGHTAVRNAPDWKHHPEFRPLVARTPIAGLPATAGRVSLIQNPSDYTGLIFSHAEHLSKTSGVARMAAGLGKRPDGLDCADCHHVDKSGKGFLKIDMLRDCQSCHSLAYAPGAAGPKLLPHGHADQVIATLQGFWAQGGFTPADLGSMRAAPNTLVKLSTGAAASNTAKIRALFAPKGLCVECHNALPLLDANSLNYRIAPVRQAERYLPWGDFNHGVKEHKQDPSGQSTCETCHKVSESKAASDITLPRIAECADCHGKTKAATQTAASSDCQECHSFHNTGAATPKPDRKPVAPGTQAVALLDNRSVGGSWRGPAS